MKINDKNWKAVIGTPEPRFNTDVAEKGIEKIIPFISRSLFLKKQKNANGIIKIDEKVKPMLNAIYHYVLFNLKIIFSSSFWEWNKISLSSIWSLSPPAEETKEVLLYSFDLPRIPELDISLYGKIIKSEINIQLSYSFSSMKWSI